MRRILAFVAVFALIGPRPSVAHRLDEYLQASRLSVARNGIVVELDLTAGANLATRVAASVDRDNDGQLSAAESEAYCRRVLTDVSLVVNDAPVPLTLTRVEAPTIAEMREGVGTIRLTAVGQLGAISGHRLFVRYRNDHRADSGVFLVNALVPQTKDLAMIGQSRDPEQREIRLEYDLTPSGRAQLGWLLVALIGVGALVAFRSQ